MHDPKLGALPATKWYLDVLTAEIRRPALVEDNEDLKRKVIRIDDPVMRKMLDLPMRENRRYAINEFLGRFRVILQENAALQKKENPTPEEKEALGLMGDRLRYLIDHINIAFMLFNCNQKVLRIQNEEVLDLLGFEAAPGIPLFRKRTDRTSGGFSGTGETGACHRSQETQSTRGQDRRVASASGRCLEVGPATANLTFIPLRAEAMPGSRPGKHCKARNQARNCRRITSKRF